MTSPPDHPHTAEATRCTRCILPADFPGAELDDRGICNHCRTGTEWPPPVPEEKRRAEEAKLRAILSRRNRRGSHDVLVGLSGGKDSAMLAWLLQHDYGARVLGYSFDSGFGSEVAKRNLRRTVERLGIELVVAPGPTELLFKVLRYFVEKDEGSLHRRFCPICSAFYGFESMRVARKHRVPYIAFGWAAEQDTPDLHTDKGHFHRSIWMPDELFRDVLGPEDREYLWDLYAESVTFLLPRPLRHYVARHASRRAFRRFVTSRPAVIAPYKGIPNTPGVFELGLIGKGDQHPADTNCDLIPLFLTHDTHELGYNPFVQEFAAYVRSGVYDRDEIAGFFDDADGQIARDAFRRDVLQGLFARMELDFDAALSRWRGKTADRREGSS